jgi:hypothetical protein
MAAHAAPDAEARGSELVHDHDHKRTIPYAASAPASSMQDWRLSSCGSSWHGPTGQPVSAERFNELFTMHGTSMGSWP